jgi:HEAT repeat protein
MKPRIVACLWLLLLVLPSWAAAPGSGQDEEPAYMGRTLREWTAYLKDADPQVRYQAAYTLSRMGPRIRRAFPALKEALKDSDPSVRQYAAEALGYTGPQALPLLLELLESDESYGHGAYMALQRMEPDPLPELLKALTEGNASRRRAVLGPLSGSWARSAEVRAALRKSLQDPDASVRITAASVIGNMEPRTPPPVDVLVAALAKQDADIRLRAVEVLSNLGPRAESAAAHLEKLLQVPDGRVRMSAAMGLCSIDTENLARMLPIIRAGLKDKDDAVCQKALYAIGQLEYRHKGEMRAALPEMLAILKDFKKRPVELVQNTLSGISILELEPVEIVPILIEILRDGELELREEAVRRLAYLAPDEAATTEALSDALEHAPLRVRLAVQSALQPLKKRPENVARSITSGLEQSDFPRERAHAARTLGSMKREARQALPVLLRLLEDKSKAVRHAAAAAVLLIEPEKLPQVLPILLRSSNGESNPYYEIVPAIQTHNDAVLSILIQALKHPDKQYRIAAAFFLNSMGAVARPVAAELRAALENPDASVRALAATTLTHLGVRDGLVSPLHEGLESNDYAIREQVLFALQGIGPIAKEFIPDLVHIVKDRSEGRLRSFALRVLGRLGPAAEAAAPAIVAAIKDRDLEVRTSAQEALAQVGIKDKAVLLLMIDMLRESVHGVRHNELDQVIRGFGSEAAEELFKRLQDNDPEYRAQVLALLSTIPGIDSDRLHATVEQALLDESPVVRLAAVSTFIGRDRESNKEIDRLLPIIKICLQSPNTAVRQQAINMLGQMANNRRRGPAPPDLLALLIEQAKSRHTQTRITALTILANISPPPPDAEAIFLDALKDDNSEVRQWGVRGVGNPQFRAKEAIPALIEVLKNKKVPAGSDATSILARFGKEDKTAADALIQFYRTAGSPYTRGSILNVLPGCGDNARAAVPLIEEAVKHDNEQLRQAAIQALTRMDPDNKALLSALVGQHSKRHDDDPKLYYRTRPDEARKPLGPPVIKELSAILLHDKLADRRVGAAVVLGTMVRNAAPAGADLKAALKDEDARVRLHAAEAYWLVTKDSRTPMPEILSSLRDKNAGQRRRAAEIIAAMGKDASHAVPQLVEILKERDERVRTLLLSALSRMGREAAPAIPLLIETLREGHYGMRVNAMLALIPFGRDAKDAVPALLEILKSGEPGDRGVAARALGQIATSAEAVKPLLEALAEPVAPERDFGLHDAIKEALVGYGPGVAGQVAELLNHKRPEVRIHAIDILSRFGQKAAFAIPLLVTAMDDKDDEASIRAAETVWHIDRRKDVLPYFVRALKAKNSYHRERAARDLMNMGGDARAAVPDLVAACRDRDAGVRREAYRTLQRLDPQEAKKLDDAEKEGSK